MQTLADNLWVLSFPLKLLGTEIGRTVTLIRLRSGDLVIHSTAPFTAADVASISALGKPAASIEATLFHDSFANNARTMFPGVPYFAPEGFVAGASGSSQSLAAAPKAWAGELELIRLDGMPRVQEHVFFHHPSRTLIVADLVFNFRASTWTHFFFRWAAGVKNYPGMSRIFRMMIRDRDAFAQSVRRMMQWDFERIIVAHGDIIESGGKEKMAAALEARGF